MSIERAVLAFAGVVVFVSAGLGHYVHENWLFLTAFAGVNLFQSAFTGFCLPAKVFKALGMKSDAELMNS